MKKLEALGQATNGGEKDIAATEPYTLEFSIEGTAPFLFHAWNPEAVEEKGRAAKGSKAKKEDNIESYVRRKSDGELAIPGEYFRQSLVHAAKYMQDPRSPRKSAMDLFKAGLIVTTELAGLGTKDWDYLDKRRVMVQRNAINRVRPAMLPGWRPVFDIMVLLPEYITRDILIKAANDAGRLVGLGDFRPTYGRFVVVRVTP